MWNEEEISLKDKSVNAKNEWILKKNKDHVVGIDVSHYQGTIRWDRVSTVNEVYKIGFVFIRATTGNDGVDAKYFYNWSQAKKHRFIRGAYHYYRPNENSIEQANLFIKNVKLQKGDLPPVLDIEKLPKQQSIDSLKVGLRRWLEKIEAHYQVKPIIYSGENYYNNFLKDEFDDYPFWIANYNITTATINDDWLFWQFTEKAKIRGIKSKVDVNIFNGTPKMLQYYTINN
ncbi:glycosyl hydrolase [Flavobacterium branchiophilum NBRC 15030 = ATCC 35035]|nr:glycosyl hydrolase [Flavobacterium branchiophilum NBRC 15030 = ATCC 35035]